MPEYQALHIMKHGLFLQAAPEAGHGPQQVARVFSASLSHVRMRAKKANR